MEQDRPDFPEPLLVPLLPPVIGGEDTPEDELEDCCAIGATGVGWTASAVLIHPRIVLTAGHVGEAGGHSQPDWVALNVTTLTSPKLPLRPTRPGNPGPEVVKGDFDPHPDYLHHGTHDIGRLVLARGSVVTPVDLATDAEIGAALKVRIAGFGFDRSPKSFGTKRDVWVDIQYMKGGAMGPAAATAAQLTFDHDLEFVAGTAQQGACYGDSGGPVYIQVGDDLKLAGVVSGGDENCAGFTVCSRIDVNRAWIQQQIADVGG